jgi:hypothetical protein
VNWVFDSESIFLIRLQDFLDGYPPARFAAEKWVMRDDDPPVGRGALSRGFCEVGVWLVLFNLKKSEF